MVRRKKSKRSGSSSPKLLQDETFEYQLALKDRALASSAEGITIADATQPDYPLIYVNEGFEKLTGYSADYACGTNCRFLQGRDTDPVAVEEIRRAIREKRKCVVEILNYRKNGEPFWNRLSITPIADSEGVITHFVGIQSDVTARRQAEDALRKSNAELENANNIIRRDLELAAEVQRSFLPSRRVNIRGASVAWELIPCDELAGDTLNAVDLNGRHIAFYVLDVSGHGVQSALLSVTLNRWLSPESDRLGKSEHEKSGDCKHIVMPFEVLEQLNRQFPVDDRTRQYFTIVYSVLDTETGVFSFACAGHPSPIYVPMGGSPTISESYNFPIGVVPEADFRESMVSMKRGDRIYLYSDGLIDATDTRGEQFGEERLMEEIANTSVFSIEDSLRAIISRLEQWSGSEKFQDDISLLGFELR